MTSPQTTQSTQADRVRPPDGMDGARQNGGPQPRGFGVVGWLRWGWRQLTSMRTALVLLFLLALASIPGSFLPQRGVDEAKVEQYFRDHTTLAPIFDKVSLFDAFSSVWFAAIYLLLFVSLAGCVLPRAWLHVKKLRSKPPAAPRNLSRLPVSRRWESDLGNEEALAAARRTLTKRRFRVVAGGDSVAAEKGYLRETGNLVFHIALLALLVSIALGSIFGYKGNVLVTEGNGFANTVTSYDKFNPGRIFSAGTLQPFQFTVDKFHARYITSGRQRGEAKSFSAKLGYRPTPDSASRSYDLAVNHPLGVDGAKVYLLGHGYAPTFKVIDGNGDVAFDGGVPFLAEKKHNFTSEGVVKVPDARPKQLGFLGFFMPTAMRSATGNLVSVFPAPKNPTVTLLAFKGNLGLDSGTPQSVYQLDTAKLKKVGKGHTLRPGQTMKLPNGAGAITFTGYKQYVTLAITYDPGRYPALFFAFLAVAGLLCSLLIRRRRVWVRVGAGEGGRSVVDVGGLTRADASGTFATEFDRLAAELREATTSASESEGTRSGADHPAGDRTGGAGTEPQNPAEGGE